MDLNELNYACRYGYDKVTALACSHTIASANVTLKK